MKTLTGKSLLSSLCQPTVGALSKGGIIPSLTKRGEGRFLRYNQLTSEPICRKAGSSTDGTGLSLSIVNF
jgi:hypothetical protein